MLFGSELSGSGRTFANSLTQSEVYNIQSFNTHSCAFSGKSDATSVVRQIIAEASKTVLHGTDTIHSLPKVEGANIVRVVLQYEPIARGGARRIGEGRGRVVVAGEPSKTLETGITGQIKTNSTIYSATVRHAAIRGRELLGVHLEGDCLCLGTPRFRQATEEGKVLKKEALLRSYCPGQTSVPSGRVLRCVLFQKMRQEVTRYGFNISLTLPGLASCITAF